MSLLLTRVHKFWFELCGMHLLLHVLFRPTTATLELYYCSISNTSQKQHLVQIRVVMIRAWKFSSGDSYERLPNRAQEGRLENTTDDIEMYPSSGSEISRTFCVLSVFVGLVMGTAIGYVTATLSTTSTLDRGDSDSIQNVVPRILLPNIRREFTSHSPFSNAPSLGQSGEEISEPIWDSLIPSKSL